MVDIFSYTSYIYLNRLQGAMKKLDVDRWSLTGTLSEALRRYIYFFEEKDLEEDIQKPENIDQYYLINNYSSKMPDILKSVSDLKHVYYVGKFSEGFYRDFFSMYSNN